ncbi:MAG: glutamate 5-kinase [Ottowia sp.]|nr:glutamate 5-kinase [Ottowia sp.]
MNTKTTPDLLQGVRRVVIKLGSSLVTNDGHGLDGAAIGRWARQAAMLARGTTGQPPRDVVLVSSGAVAEGMQRLGWPVRPRALGQLQAAAAVGQMGLAQVYESTLRKHGVTSAQVLLTHADLADRERYLNARTTLLTLFEHGVVPVINENDTVVNDGIKVGDNDTLAALVANLIEADLLVILTDQLGLFTADPRSDPQAELVQEARAGEPLLERIAGGAGTHIGTGGMLTKVLAAKRAAGSGASTVIAPGREPDVLLRLLGGERIGTLLLATTHKMRARKQWIADHLQLRGAVVADAGAIAKVEHEGKSLLPVGMTAVHGVFSRGDVVAIQDGAGRELARGLANYSSTEARLLCRKPSSQIEALLGYQGEAEMIHRDNLVLTR